MVVLVDEQRDGHVPRHGAHEHRYRVAGRHGRAHLGFEGATKGGARDVRNLRGNRALKLSACQRVAEAKLDDKVRTL